MPLLQIADLTAFYGSFQALFGVSLTVETGEAVAIIGANGAGKSTFLSAIAGLLPAPRGAITFDGRDLADLSAFEIARAGVALVPEGRRLFGSMSVEENLLIGGDANRRQGPWSLDRVYSLFPVLAERRRQSAKVLSGGQQQMTAIGRALMSNPRLLLCDELSLGLAPVVIRDIYSALDEIRSADVGIVLVEQDIGQAMKVSDRFYCFLHGKVTLSGSPAEASREAIHAAYFGL
jgi:branched-chain amino acid transport system ATP-binding protein